MRPITNLIKNTYSNVNVSYRSNSAGVKSYGAGAPGVNAKSGAASTNKKDTGAMAVDMREIRRMLSASGQAQNANAKAGSQNSIVSNMFSYTESLKAQRQQAKDANLKLKKLKYQFKDMSSKILRSKTSTSARQVVSQAKREVLRLKREKQSGLYEDEEIDAAITHAKAMERVAKKKARHLEEEEMAKAAGGPCLGEMTEEKEKDINAEEMNDEEYSDEYEDEISEEYDAAAYDEAFLRQEFEDIMSTQSDMTEEMSELTEELFDEFAEEMQAMLEDMGMDELSESLSAAKGDMDPADLKMMKIKHRNKEMKDIVEADSEYLKAVFDQLAKQKAGGSIPGAIPSTGGAASMPAPMFGDAMAMPEPTINITL